MTRMVALLRGINVGGRRKVPMARLREVAASLGFDDVSTYIASGNLLFSASSASKARTALEAALETEFGFDVPTVVLTDAQLQELHRANPFPKEAASAPKSVHAVVCSGAPDLDGIEQALARATKRGSQGEQVRAIGRTIYLLTPGGIGRSILAEELSRGGSGSAMKSGTARNWATISRLVELVAQ